MNRSLIHYLIYLDEDIEKKVLKQIKESLPHLSFDGNSGHFNEAVYTIKEVLGNETLLRWIDTFNVLNSIKLEKSDMSDPEILWKINDSLEKCRVPGDAKLNRIAKSVERKLNTFLKEFFGANDAKIFTKLYSKSE